MTNQEFADRLKALSQEAFDFRKTLTPETDRGCALMAGSFLDNRLKTLIESRLVDERKLIASFLEFNGAAGTFSARINCCYLFGFLPREQYLDLHLIRHIRNKFGHTAEPISFDTKEIHERCRQLRTRAVGDDAAPRLLFTNTCYGILAATDIAIARSTRFEAPKSLIGDHNRDQLRESSQKILALVAGAPKEKYEELKDKMLEVVYDATLKGGPNGSESDRAPGHDSP